MPPSTTTPTPSTTTSSSGTATNRTWTPDNTVVLVFALIGLLGGVVLLRYFTSFPIVVSLFLATGVASLVYKFLGGLEGVSFTVGAAKLTGTCALLVFLAMLINSQITKQLQFHLVP